MLHEAKNAAFLATRGLRGRRFRFVAGTVACERSLSRRAHAELARSAAKQPVAVAAVADGRRRYWWFRGRFWWEEDDLDADDVTALVLERERRRERRLERARAGLAGGLGPPAGMRQGIPLEVKRAVWQRCGGRCVECGADSLLEFDHVIPLAMGGSDGERNLQLLCAECNRGKGASL
jgi:hypothetical protein